MWQRTAATMARLRSRPNDSTFEGRRAEDIEFLELVRGLLHDAECPMHVLLKRHPGAREAAEWQFESDYYCAKDVEEDRAIYATQQFETRALAREQADEVCSAWANELWKTWVH